MDPSSVGGNGGVKKLEDGDSPDSRRDLKPQAKTLNRVPSKFSLFLTFSFC